MKERVLRLRLPEMVYRKFKIACVEKDLSMTKQTVEFIRKFLEVYDQNKPFIRE